MTLHDKVEWLLRYCGQYQSHGYMVDERNLDVKFNVQLPGEMSIRQSMKDIKIIIHTDLQEWERFKIIMNDKHNYLQCGQCGCLILSDHREYKCPCCGQKYVKVTQISN